MSFGTPGVCSELGSQTDLDPFSKKVTPSVTYQGKQNPREAEGLLSPSHCRLRLVGAEPGPPTAAPLVGDTPALCSEAVGVGKWVIWLLYLVNILIRLLCHLETIFSFIFSEKNLMLKPIYADCHLVSPGPWNSGLY